MAKPWRLAGSLTTFRDEVNGRWKDRTKAADGTIGDRAHRKQKSDHNPNKAGVVTAIDITNDERYAVGTVIWEHLRTTRPTRLKYAIFNHRIMSSYDHANGPAYTPRPYSGSNPHVKHIHLSVVGDATLYDDRALWGLTRKMPDMQPPTVKLRLLRTPDTKVWLVMGGVRAHVSNPTVFAEMGWDWDDVVDVDADHVLIRDTRAI